MPGPKGMVRNPIHVAIFSVLTCNIYGLWWWYTVMREVREFSGDESIDPTTNLILLIVLGCLWPYILAYKMGKWLVNAQRIAGLPEEDKSTTYLILSLVCFPVEYYMIQSQLNQIWESGGGVPPFGVSPPMHGM